MSATGMRVGFILLFCLATICAESQVIPAKPVLAYVPHLTVGSGFLTRVTILNLANSSNTVQVNLISDSGTLLQSTNYTIPANGSKQIVMSGERFGASVKYWAVVGADAAIGVNTFIELIGSGGPTNVLNTIGFNDSQLQSNFTIPVEFEPTPAGGAVGRTVGLAVANPHASSTTVTMRLVNASGITLATATATLPAYGQTAIDLSTHPSLSPALPRSNIVGTLVVSATATVAALALGDDFGPFFASPPMGTGLSRITIPHVISGGGFLTKLTLVNLSAVTNTATVTYYNQSGGVVQTSSITLAPYGTSRTSTPESGRWGTSQTQWAQITAQQPVAANVFFELHDTHSAVVNTIGFNDITALSHFVIPVDLLLPPKAGDIGMTAGVALANPNPTSSTATLSLINDQGTTAATSTVTVPGNGQTAVDILSIAAFRAAVPLAGFHGRLRVDATSPLAPIALADDWGPFFATPPFEVSASSPGSLSLDGNWAVGTTSTAFAGESSTLVGWISGSPTKGISAAMHIAGSGCFNFADDATFTGQLSGTSVHATSAPIAGQVITLDGTVTPSLSGLSLAGTYSISGGCANGDRGTVSGYRSADATGSWTGTAVSSSGDQSQLTASIVQSTTDSHGFYAVSGSVQFTNSPCFTNLVFTNSDSLGAGPIIVADLHASGSVYPFVEVALVMDPSGKTLLGAYDVYGGQCANDSGSFTLTR